MKQKLLFFLFIPFIVFCFSCKKNANNVSDCNSYPIPQGSYNYPIKPGTSAWTATPDTLQLQVCQIPDLILTKMSTDAVIQSWVDFPLNYEIHLASSLQFGMLFFLNNFSGLKELQKRSDAGKKLFERYTYMNPLCILNYSSNNDKGAFCLSFSYIEMLLGQDTILNNLSIEDKKLIVAEALKKYNAEKKYDSYFSQIGYATSLFVCARTMRNANYQPFINSLNTSTILKQYINLGNFPLGVTDGNLDIQTLIQLSSNFIN